LVVVITDLALFVGNIEWPCFMMMPGG